MRYSTGINATRKHQPVVRVVGYPNPTTAPEVQIDLGGLSVWLSEQEATRLGQDLIEAGIRIRSEAEHG